MKNKISAAIIISLLIMPACNDQTELDQDTMVGVYVNIVIAEETYPDNLDSLTAKTKRVFESFGVTEDEYEYTLYRFKEDKDYWDEFFKKSLTYLDSLKSAAAD